MDNTNRLEFIRQEVNTILMNQKDTEHRREGFVHLYGVAQNCSLLALKRKLNVELCIITGLLHDIYTYQYCYVKEHAMLGAIEAEKLLRNSEQFTEEEIRIVKTAIHNHSNKKIKHDKYSELIKNADVLQDALYKNSLAVKHKKRLEKTLKTLGVKTDSCEDSKKFNMDKIVQNYNSLVKDFKAIVKESGEREIHDKRVILRRIFPILSALKIKPSKLKNGEKAFRIFGKLRDVQVQIMHIESMEQYPETTEYLSFIKVKEDKLRKKVRKFSKKKKLKFPKLKKNAKINYSKIHDKASTMLNNLIDMAQSEKITDTNDIHRIRIQFKKFRYVVEILSYIESANTVKADILKPYQDLLGEIQDYEVLIEGFEKFYTKKNRGKLPDVEIVEKKQNALKDTFKNDLETFIAVCSSAIRLDTSTKNELKDQNSGECN